MRTLLTLEGRSSQPSAEDVRRLVADEDRPGFWLDIESPGDDDYALLLDTFHFHPLTVEDVRIQNQRPKMDEFPGHVFTVLFTVERHGDRLDFHEHHVYLGGGRLVTVHHDPAPPLAGLRERLAGEPALIRGDQRFLDYLVVNTLVESLFPVLDEVDERIDRLEDSIVGRWRADALGRITRLKHEVTDLRRVLGAQRDVFQRLLTHSLDDPGDDVSLYWRDVYEHLIRQHEQLDSLRDLLTGTMDVYLSTASNRLNETIKQLTVIASLFLPLTFLAGFFGMNFGFLVSRISSAQALGIGVALMAISVAVQLVVFRRRGWL